MDSEDILREHWDSVANDLKAYREFQRQGWGDIDDALVGRYLAGEVSPDERARIEVAAQKHPQLRELIDLVRVTLNDFAPISEAPTPLPLPAAPAAEPAAEVAPTILRFPAQTTTARRRVHQRFAMVAAACLFLAVSGALMWVITAGPLGPESQTAHRSGEHDTQLSPQAQLQPKKIQPDRPVPPAALAEKDSKVVSPPPDSPKFSRNLPPDAKEEKKEGPPSLPPSPYGVRKFPSAFPYPQEPYFHARSPVPAVPHSPTQTFDLVRSNPYLSAYDPYRGRLRGTADVYRSVGTLQRDVERTANNVLLSPEAAERLRLAAQYPRLDAGRHFALEAYIQANTPAYTGQQARVAQLVLKRIQAQATSGEVQSGEALNFLLEDIARLPAAPVGPRPPVLEWETLKRLNVTTAGGGERRLLGKDGRLTWPVALRQVGTPQERDAVQALARQLTLPGSGGPGGEKLVKDLQSNLTKLHEGLRARADEVPARQYVEARRFLNELDATVLSADRVQAYHRFIRGGKSVAELAHFMLYNDLVFAPAAAGDEPAYLTVHTALAAYDIHVNAGAANAPQP